MLFRVFHRDGTEVVVCEQHLAEIVATEEETIGKVENEQSDERCCMCKDQKDQKI